MKKTAGFWGKKKTGAMVTTAALVCLSMVLMAAVSGGDRAKDVLATGANKTWHFDVEAEPDDDLDPADLRVEYLLYDGVEYSSENSEDYVEWVYHAEECDYERYVANNYYNKESEYFGKSDALFSDRFELEYERYEFDEEGNGIRIYDPGDTLGMHHHTLMFNFTENCGKTWISNNAMIFSNYIVNDVRVWGNRVYLCLRDDLSPYVYFVYTEDRFRTYATYSFNTALSKMNPALSGRIASVKIVDVSKTDGTVVFGVVDSYDEYEDYIGESYIGGSEEKTFLIIKVDPSLKTFQVLYSDDAYIKKTEQKHWE